MCLLKSYQIELTLFTEFFLQEKLQNAVTNLKQLEEECMKRKVFTTKQISEWNVRIWIY